MCGVWPNIPYLLDEVGLVHIVCRPDSEPRYMRTLGNKHSVKLYCYIRLHIRMCPGTELLK